MPKSKYVDGRLIQKLARYAIGVLMFVVLAGHVAGFYSLGLIKQLDVILYDTKLLLTMPRSVDERIVIIDIDEKSLAEIGRWPWGRDRLAQLVMEAFERYKIALLAMDVVFAESDQSSGLPVLEKLARGPLRSNASFQSVLPGLRAELNYDQQFADVISKYPVILGFIFANDSEGTSTGALPPPVLPSGAFNDHGMAIATWDRYSGNRPTFQRVALGGGYVNGAPDFDGVSRRIPLIAEYKGNYYESLSLAVVRALAHGAKPVLFLPQNTLSTRAGYQAAEAIALPTQQGTIRIPIDTRAMTLIPYRGLQKKSYAYYSAADLIAGRIPLDALSGKIAFFGSTAPGLLDLRATPVGAAYPGVEVHANMVSGMLDGTLKAYPAYVVGVEVILLVLIALIMVFWLPGVSPLSATLVSGALLVFLVGINLALWQYANLVIPLASTLVLTVLLYTLDMSFGYFFETHAKHRLTKLFELYVPPELVEEMSKNPDRYDMEGRSAELTVLFADIRAFTTLSEGLAPQAMARLMNEYFSAMTAVIRANRGTLDKYIGDAIMAFWGAPVDDPLHARHAVLTALEMQRKLAVLNAEFSMRDWPKLATGIGINTGIMTVGDMGSRERKAYTVLGDAVNLADRLEGLTAYYGIGIIIGEATQKILPDLICREIDQVQVKGRSGAVRIYEPLGFEAEIRDTVKREIGLWLEGLDLYRAKDWDAAEKILRHLLTLAPQCKLYTLYLKRIAGFRIEPPGVCDVVWQFEKKSFGSAEHLWDGGET